MLLSAAQALPFFLLTCALLAAWAGNPRALLPRTAWLPLLLLAVAAALRAQVIAWPALPSIAVLLAAAGLHRHWRERGHAALGWASLAVLVLAGLAVAIGLAPGFHPVPVYRGELSPASSPLLLQFNFGKALAGLLLLAAIPAPRVGFAHWRAMFRQAGWIWLGTPLAVLGLAWLSGRVALDPKLAPIMLAWAWGNLFFTVIAEEAMFRGIVQERIGHLLARFRHGPIIALLLAACLFGALHLGGGMAYALLALLAGAGYGWAYLKTRRLEAAVVGHFGLNLAHILLFSYPAAA